MATETSASGQAAIDSLVAPADPADADRAEPATLDTDAAPDAPVKVKVQRRGLSLPALKRWQAFALAMTCIGSLYIYKLGSYGLWDCWETYYGEVPREMVEDNDYLSPRWHNGVGPDGNAESTFWSKPVLTFWLEAAAMRASGSQRWITPGQTALSRVTEWMMRIPSAGLGLFAILLILIAVGRIFGTRAGVLSALALGFMPQWGFISRQAITDMPYVGPMTAALCFVMLSWFTDDVPLKRRVLRKKEGAKLFREIVWEPVAWVVIGLAVLFFLGEVAAMFMPLLHTPLPIRGLHTAGTLVLLPYTLLIGLYVVLAATRTRTRNALYIHAAYMLVAAAFLAKGILGFGLPGIVLVGYFVIGRDLKVLRRLEIVAGLPLFLALAFPWVHAMLVAHGIVWWNELFVENQFRRAGKGEQSQAVGTCEYYIKEIGYGTFPIGALLPVSLAQRLGPAELGEDTQQARARRFVVIWFVVMLAFWAMVITKYHHYILPVLAPGAILIGLFLDDLLADRVRAPSAALLLSGGLALLIGYDLAHNPEQWVWLFTYLYTPPWDQGVPQDWIHFGHHAITVLGLAGILFAVVLAAMSIRRLRRVGFALLGVGLFVFTAYTLDSFMTRAALNWTQKDTIAYYYSHRASPDEPIVAWQLNWRGETFYTDAQVVVSMSADNTQIIKYLQGETGQHVWFVTEANRLEAIRAMLPTQHGKDTLKLEYDENVHFMLASATL
jgi:4-amino-4-deoxy-L-arabinose transferase-like glycosyltransferase